MDEMNARLTPNREQINGTLEADNQPMSASLMMSRTYNTPTYLSDLGDVTITSPQNEQVLQYDGSKWVNGTVEGGGSSYTNLTNKPKINNVELSGNKTGAQLGLASASDIPTKTSDLTNDSKFISDSDYNHTDNNFTDDEKTKLNGLESVSWTQNTTSGTKIASINIGGTSTDVYAPTSGGGGSTDYSELTSKPKINNVELAGNKTSSDLGLANETHTHTKSQITDMISKTSELTNDSNFISDANYTHIDVTDTYSSTGSDAVSGKAVASAIGGLDVASVGGSGKYISAISETDGKISATATDFPEVPTVSDTYSATSTNAMSGKAVASAIGELNMPEIGNIDSVVVQLRETAGKIGATTRALGAVVDGTNIVYSDSRIRLSSDITGKLGKLDTDTTATTGQALTWDGTKFTPTTIQGGISPSSILSTISAVENNTTSGKVVDALVIKDYSNRHTNSVISTLTANNNEITITNDVFKDDNATFEFMFEPTLNASSEYEYLTLSGYTLNTTTGVLVLTVSNAPTVNTRVRVDVSTYRA